MVILYYISGKMENVMGKQGHKINNKVNKSLIKSLGIPVPEFKLPQRKWAIDSVQTKVDVLLH